MWYELNILNNLSLIHLRRFFGMMLPRGIPCLESSSGGQHPFAVYYAQVKYKTCFGYNTSN